MDIFNKIINEAVITTLSKARKNVDKNPTDGQKEAGNYRKGHVNVLGFQITIENPKGSYRKGKDKDGHEWKTLMHNDYGYFVRTLGKDGDAIDVFIGPNLKSQKIFPIDQFVNGEFDETKVMLGFDNKEEAKAAYLSNYEKDWKGFKYITEVDIDTFKKWLYDGYRQRKPFAKYARLTENHNTTIKNNVKNSTLYEATNFNDEIWYRGYESQFGFNGIDKNVLWLTDDIDYARCYGNRVAEVVIDGNKLNPASIDEMDGLCSDDCEFDYYDGPDDNTIAAAMEEGFNCYCFYANNDSSYCMCLWDNSAIKNIRELSEEETNAIEGYEGYDITPYRTSLAESKKQRKNDEGKVVPEKCECGGDVVLQIHGEPVYVCKKCGKYFGTMPFSKKLNESADWGPVQDAWEEYSCTDLLWEFLDDKRTGRAHKHWDVIPAEQYHNLLRRYMENPSMARTPNIVKEWMEKIIIKNTLSIEYITQLAGHSSNFPFDDCESVFGEEIAKNFGYDFYEWFEYLDNLGFYEWCSLPDGSDGWSDYGVKPIYKILNEYDYGTSPEDTLILINRVLDVYHCRGDLASAFIQGGSHSCDYISNSINESIDIKKALKNLKKRRDPANIENWDSKMINESFNSPLLAKYAKEHGGLKVYRNGGLRDGVAAYHGGINIDPAQVTDDMLYGEPFKYEWANASNPWQSKNTIHFADGYAVMVKPYDHTRRDNIYVPEPRKKTSRYGSGIGDTGDHNKSRGGFVGNGKDAISAPYNGFSVSDRAGEGQMRREAWNNNLKDIKYWKEKIKELENEIENEPDFYRRNVLQKEIYDIKRKIANAQENVGEIKKYSRNLRGVTESKEHKPPKDVAAAIRKANRDADIESHGKATDFRTTITKNPKAYSRKEKHKKQISENVLRQIIRESIEEFYRGSRKEKAAYENACDCLYYGYGFKFWFERNSELLDGDVEFAKKIWCQAKEDLANDF